MKPRHGPVSTSQLLLDAAARWPDRTFLRIDGGEVTFAGFADDTLRLAAGLRQRGLGPGDRLAVFMQNSLACLHTWFATNLVGATWAPINDGFRGPGLRHALAVADPRLIVVDATYLPEVVGSSPSSAIEIVVNGPEADPGPGPHPTLSSLFGDRELATPHLAAPSEIAALLFTSGTTGRSKACMLSHGYMNVAGGIFARELEISSHDVLYCPFPLYHLDATALTTIPALLTGACAAIGRRFSASGFWDEVRAVQATVIEFMGATLAILQKQDPRSDDGDNPVRLAWGVPATEQAAAFEERFDLRTVVPYGSTEANLCAVQRPSREYPPGTCGQAVEEIEVRIVAGQDARPCPVGEPGEIVVRPRVPHAIFSGYFGMPDATSAAMRDGWFHTGDVGCMDADGNLTFISRAADVIRRRGENISAFEVEEVILRHPAVSLCAVVGVPSELTEEDVKAVVVVAPGHSVREQEIAAACEGLLARFQVPRYYELVDDLPRTPTGKVEKHRLRHPPVGPTTWDRETGDYVGTVTA